MKNVMKYHLESEVAFCRDILSHEKKIPIPGLTKSWDISTIKNPESRGKFQNNSLLEKFLLQKKVAKLIPIPGLWDFWGFLFGIFSGISNSDPDPRISDLAQIKKSRSRFPGIRIWDLTTRKNPFPKPTLI